LDSYDTNCQHISAHQSTAVSVNDTDTRLLDVKQTNVDVHDVHSHIDMGMYGQPGPTQVC